MDGFIVEKDSVGLFAMRAQALAVIGSNHDQRVVVQLAGSQAAAISFPAAASAAATAAL